MHMACTDVACPSLSRPVTAWARIILILPNGVIWE